MEFKAKTATEALEKIANASREYHWGCDQIFIYDLPFEMSDVQDYAKATLNNQPKLSIPKKIAELLDVGFEKLYPKDVGISSIYNLSRMHFSEKEHKRLLLWDRQTENANALAVAYLASKALGVELVEVEE
ncbi:MULTISPECIES: hypothetical protein [Lactococcus]|uniref:hypothetical protein n=1 Tax=Lactococcus TaxID=1357 RepID=UPI00203C4D79|nr:MULTISPECIES: hypothetical protein [Lactococcus]